MSTQAKYETKGTVGYRLADLLETSVRSSKEEAFEVSMKRSVELLLGLKLNMEVETYASFFDGANGSGGVLMDFAMRAKEAKSSVYVPSFSAMLVVQKPAKGEWVEMFAVLDYGVLTTEMGKAFCNAKTSGEALLAVADAVRALYYYDAGKSRWTRHKLNASSLLEEAVC